MKLGKFKYFIAICILWVICQSCFQFRMSDSKQLKELAEVSIKYDVDIGYKEVSGRQIHYTYVSSDSSKPLAVFIHGSPGSSSNFIQFAKDTALLSEYNVLLLDRPGFGYSDFGKGEPSILIQASILHDVIREFPENDRVVVGHSLGGPIIVRMAMTEPDFYRKLLVIAGSVSPELEPEEKWRKPLDSPLLRWLMPRSFCVSNQEILLAKENLIEMERDWKKVLGVVHIIQGGKDNLVPAGNEDYAKMMLINAEDVVLHKLPEANHFIPFTQPELVRDVLLDF